MKLEEILPIISNVPHMSVKQGELIYKMILENEIFDILELGTAHGTGSCYMAAALHEKGKGSVLTIDNKNALSRNPNANDLLRKCNLEAFATPLYASTSYNWELMKIIDRQTKDGICEPIFDFCYLDGAHNFEIDCCAFFLVDKLLKPNGYILFDDLNWTYAKSPSLKNTDWVKSMSPEERETPHIKKIVELIVNSHLNYSNANRLEEWVLFRKKSDVKMEFKKIDLNRLNSKNQKFTLRGFVKKILS